MQTFGGKNSNVIDFILIFSLLSNFHSICSFLLADMRRGHQSLKEKQYQKKKKIKRKSLIKK